MDLPPLRIDYMEGKRLDDILLEKVMAGDWDMVVDFCMARPVCLKFKITSLGDTVCHLAVLDGRYDAVQKLKKLICEEDVTEEALGVANVRGNTPLHLAASVGSVSMCECIAAGNVWPIGERNVDGETPLFLAALLGHKYAFLCDTRWPLMAQRKPYVALDLPLARRVRQQISTIYSNQCINIA
ncbi:hypothetical protein RJ640_029422 [Escallonia rubra]|uniref:Uncharacterized protein n=1 Tax=Escallonia rubra TaxID=112253 RepID=A0AA88RJQ3_9ASTE|nr:hypothetical protein RJ640_029422 [Escallonia rubra]